MIRRELHESNRLSWNAATRAHNSHKRDQAAFLAKGMKRAEVVELATVVALMEGASSTYTWSGSGRTRCPSVPARRRNSPTCASPGTTPSVAFSGMGGAAPRRAPSPGRSIQETAPP